MDNPDVERVGKRIVHKIECSSCGAEDSVPFKPDPDSRVLCRECHRKEKEARNKARRKLKGEHPAEKHGTQVRIDIQCDRCGAQDTLPYLPRTDGAILCTSCAEETFGEQWTQRHKMDEGSDYPFTCTRCGRRDFVPFEPEPDRELLCFRCLNDHAVPNPDGKDEAEMLSPHLYRRPGRRQRADEDENASATGDGD